MRLVVDKWGLLQSFEDAQKSVSVKLSDNFEINTKNNISLQQYDVVYEEVED